MISVDWIRCFSVETTPHHDQPTLAIHLPALILFGFGSIILGLFDIPGSIQCKAILNNNTAILGNASAELNSTWAGVLEEYSLIESLAIVKGTYIAIQVSI